MTSVTLPLIFLGENQEIEGKSEKYPIKRYFIKEYGRYGQFQCSVQYCARCEPWVSTLFFRSERLCSCKRQLKIATLKSVEVDP